MADGEVMKPSGLRRKASLNVTFSIKKQRDRRHLKIAKILQKSVEERTAEDIELLTSSADIAKEISIKREKRKKLLARAEEFEDNLSVLQEKCYKLANAIKNSQHLVIYSGAGVSTAASIPDYRGSNGIWTRLQQGKEIGNHDLSAAEPTLAHMALYSLYRKGLLKYVVSQNCDGLHLRSGLPRKVLSEVHGNMNLEVCTECNVQFWRSFDVTEHTARYAHKTARRCSQCFLPLRDTIVHFGERGNLAWPINWTGACQAAKQADIILCIGSSLKVLKRYPWLWGMDKPAKKRPQLYIVNLQWTPKDHHASLKINGKCDDVMKLVMRYLNLEIPQYDRSLDPIFTHATELHVLEEHTINTQMLVSPDIKQESNNDFSLDFKSINEQKIEKIVSDIKKENDIWRPFSNEINILPKNQTDNIENKDLPCPSIETSGITVEVDLFDRMYQEIAMKILKETNVEYYNKCYEEHNKCYEEPLDLSKPKVECDFCYRNYSTTVCYFYLKREIKLAPTGPPCYCCDSDDEPVDPSATVPSEVDNKKIANPGWFGKGYRKRFKKKR